MSLYLQIGRLPSHPFLVCISLFSSVQLLSHVQHFATPWTAARQASLSITNSWSLLKLMSVESVMLSSHLILCLPLLLLPSIFPSIRVFSNESLLCIRWPKYWSFSFSPSNEHPGLTSLRLDWLDLLAVQGTLLSNTTVQKHQFFGTQLSLWSNSHIHDTHTWIYFGVWMSYKTWTSQSPPASSAFESILSSV